MAKLKPWFHVVQPREDLRDGRPLDASEFAVHLDHIRDGRAPKDYQEPARFFERTYATRALTDLAAQTVRRLSGIKVETSAVFNMATQFGGGKSHALTLLYHLAKAGEKARGWKGVAKILEAAQVKTVPQAATAVFVGTEFDSITGRGGKGEPIRRTPWGEIAWQVAGEKGFAVVAEHDERGTAPAGDVIRAFLPKDGPALILMDELMNWVSRNRKSGLATQLYNFLQNLSEEARARENIVLAVSIPASEIEMSPDDHQDYDALKKMLDRVGKPILISAERETAEIIRRRLFEWEGLPAEAKKTAGEYADWVRAHKKQIGDFPVDTAEERFADTYPFHPALLSVFERKWQSLPRFQKTRGVLRLLALWVSQAYQVGFKGAEKDPLIGLGTAPLGDPLFRAALFEQLGNSDLEGAVTTDIAGKKDSHAVQLDREAEEAVKKTHLHQRVATTILFESNGGQTRTEATVPEIRLAVCEPALDIANVERAIEGLMDRCYYLSGDRNRYYFSLKKNLNKLLADRRAGIEPKAIEERIRKEIIAVFKPGFPALDRKPFPESTSDIPDTATLTLAIMAPERNASDQATRKLVEQIVREHGGSGRTFKSAIFFAAADSNAQLQDEARKLLAWEDIADDDETNKDLDEAAKRQLKTATERSSRDLKEAVWRAYKHLFLLGKDNTLKHVDLGLVHSSAATSVVELIVNRLRNDDELTERVGPTKLVKAWPPAKPAWSTREVRDAFYSSPTLQRLLDPSTLRRTIADGVAQGLFAYAGRDPAGKFNPVHLNEPIAEGMVDISEDMFLVKPEHIEPPKLARIEVLPALTSMRPGQKQTFTVTGFDGQNKKMPSPAPTWSATGGTVDANGLFVAGESLGRFEVRARVGDFEEFGAVDVVARPATAKFTGGGDLPPTETEKGVIRWSGSVPPQQWMNFYTKVLTRFVQQRRLKKIEVSFEATRDSVDEAEIAELRSALRELKLDDHVEG